MENYSCKMSNHVYTNNQKLILLILRQFFCLSYRDFCDRVASFPRVCNKIGLKTVPHHSTLEKYSQTVNLNLLHKIISIFSIVCENNEITVAIDGTGFSEPRISRYYVKRKKDFKLDPDPPKRRGYSKASYAVDVKSKIIWLATSATTTIMT